MNRHGHCGTHVDSDVTLHVRTELNETVSGRIDMSNSTRALQNVPAKPAASRPHRISGPIPKGSNEKGKFRNFMSDPHLGMQAWFDERETMLVGVESTDKFDNSTLAVEVSEEEFGTIEASMSEVLHRTTASEPLRIVQQTQGPKGFEAWRAIMRRCGQRNMSEKNSAYAALVSNIRERDRAKDAEQFQRYPEDVHQRDKQV